MWLVLPDPSFLCGIWKCTGLSPAVSGSVNLLSCPKVLHSSLWGGGFWSPDTSRDPGSFNAAPREWKPEDNFGDRKDPEAEHQTQILLWSHQSASQPSLLPTLRGPRSVSVKRTFLVLSLDRPAIAIVLFSHAGLEGQVAHSLRTTLYTASGERREYSLTGSRGPGHSQTTGAQRVVLALWTEIEPKRRFHPTQRGRRI